MATETPQRNLHQRLAAICGEMEPIAKSGRNTSQNYSFIEQAQVVAAVRPLLAQHGVAIIPQIEDVDVQPLAGGKGTYTSVKVTFDIVNTDDPADHRSVAWHGDASDYADKGLNKALTAAQKTFLMKLFQISDADPDADSGDAPAPRPQPARPIGRPPTPAPAAQSPVELRLATSPANNAKLIETVQAWEKEAGARGIKLEGRARLDTMPRAELQAWGEKVRERVEAFDADAVQSAR